MSKDENDRLVREKLHKYWVQTVYTGREDRLFDFQLKTKNILSTTVDENFRNVLSNSIEAEPIQKPTIPREVRSLAWAAWLYSRLRPMNGDTRFKLVRPPGHWSLAVLEFIFPKKAMDQVFTQAVLDMREEHAEALAAKRIWKARTVALRGRVGLLLTVASYLTTSVVKKIIGIWTMTG